MPDMINPNWGRWIYSSLTSHFDEARQGYPFYVEGQNRSETVSSFAEFRSNGPFYNQVNGGVYDVTILAAIIIQVVSDNADIHRLERVIGIFASAFVGHIDLFKYGDTIDDDQSKFACLLIDSDVRIDKFGVSKVGVSAVQASIEATYKTSLFTR